MDMNVPMQNVQDNSGTSGMTESISYSKTNVIFTPHALFLGF
jgi:hypothetical protein